MNPRRHPHWLLGLALALALAPAAGADVVIDLGRGPVTVHVPPSYDPATPAPLVVLLHGYTSSGQETEDYLQLTPLADQLGFLYVYPDGTVDAIGNRFWNATDACCDFFLTGVDDSGYLRALIDAIAAELSVDAGRIFVAGHSSAWRGRPSTTRRLAPRAPPSGCCRSTAPPTR